ncbi:MAG: YafY family protein [Bacteroidota bacterium]
MNRIDRLTAILTHLQSKKRVTLQELEDRFELSRRTIFRDIRALNETGVPIGGNASEGYFIVEGYHLPPVVFNKEEASSLLLGAKFVEQYADENSQKVFNEALMKIKAVLRYADRDFLESLEDNIKVVAAPSIAKMGFPDSHLAEIQFALGSNRTLQFEYVSNYSQEHTAREVEPLGLVFYSTRWHLIAYCQMRKALRDFRTDRIQKLKLTDHTFDRNRHPDYMEFLNQALQGTDAKEATLKFTEYISRFIGEQKYYYGLVSDEVAGDHIIMKFVTPYYEMLGHWIMSYGDQVEVVSPPELKALTSQYARELAKHHIP